MPAIFIQIKCDLGHTYDVAARLVDEIEEVSEVFSTSGSWDLLVKCFVPPDTDIGRFVAEKIQSTPHIRDTYTIMTFNAFT